ncbi:MAG: hypothetical protein BJ554DRAFT_255, partial [Olpidium bornovanus]
KELRRTSRHVVGPPPRTIYDLRATVLAARPQPSSCPSRSHPRHPRAVTWRSAHHLGFRAIKCDCAVSNAAAASGAALLRFATSPSSRQYRVRRVDYGLRSVTFGSRHHRRLDALHYGFYATLVKKCVSDGDSVSPALFCRLVGTLNIIMLWPGFLALNDAGIKPFKISSVLLTGLFVVTSGIPLTGSYAIPDLC